MTKDFTPLRFGARRLGELQHDVMVIVWEDGGWVTPRQVTEKITRNRAYTTVMTVMTRLEEQGILERRRNGRSYEYRSILSHDEFYADRLADVLKDSGDKASTLARFVEQLDGSQQQELADLLSRTPTDQGDHRGP